MTYYQLVVIVLLLPIDTLTTIITQVAIALTSFRRSVIWVVIWGSSTTNHSTISTTIWWLNRYPNNFKQFIYSLMCDNQFYSILNFIQIWIRSNSLLILVCVCFFCLIWSFNSSIDTIFFGGILSPISTDCVIVGRVYICSSQCTSSSIHYHWHIAVSSNWSVIKCCNSNQHKSHHHVSHFSNSYKLLVPKTKKW